MSKISKSDVEHIAGLARIKLGEKEKEKMASELGVILGYIDKLKEADTEGMEPISNITGMENVLREDLPSTTLGTPKVVLGEENKKPRSFDGGQKGGTDAVKLIEMASEKKNNFVKVPAVFKDN